LASYSWTGTTAAVGINGATPTAGTLVAYTSTETLLWVGNDNGSYITANIGEIILYDSVLTTTQRQEVEGYLAWKWGFETSTNSPTSIGGLAVWLDGADESTKTLSGTTVTAWRDKASSYSFTAAAVASQGGISVTGPSNVPGGGVVFTNATSLNGNGEQALGIYSSSSNSSPLFTIPTQSATLIVASSPTLNDYYRAMAFLGSAQLSGPAPNMALSLEAGVNLGETIALDYSGSAWGQYFQPNSQPSTLAPRIDIAVSAPGAAVGFWNNGAGLGGTGSYTSSYSNYPICAFYIGGYTSTVWGNRNFNGTIYEVLFYSNALTTAQRRQVEGYLSKKWSIPLTTSLPNSHPFYTIKPYLRTFRPIDIDGCALWLDGNDATTLTLSGSNVTSWNDKSGNGNNANIVTSTPPTYVSNAVVFTASNSTGLRGNMNASLTNASVFIVTSYISNSGSPIYNPRLFILGSNNSTDNNLIGQLSLIDQGRSAIVTYVGNGTGNAFGVGNFQTGGTISFSTAYLYTNISTYSGTTFTNSTPVNGYAGTYATKTGTMATGGSYVGSANRYAIGNYMYSTAGPNGDAYNGNVYEVIVYSNALTTSQRQQVEGYLAQKWNLVTTTPAFSNPLSVSGLQLWLDASDSSTVTTSGSNVTNVRDKSPNNLTLAGATGFSYPNNTFNGTYPSFYGSNRSNAWNLGSNSISLSQPLTVFFVGMRPPISTNFYDGYIFDGLNSTNRIYQYGDNYTTGALTNTTMIPGRFPNVPLLITSVYNTTNSSQYVNGTQVFSNINGGTSNLTSGIRIANSFDSTNSWVGHFCEFLIYNSVLSTLQRQQIEYYLANKWGLRSVVSFAPPSLPNCALWFDAADTSPTSITTSGTQITVWWDKSRNGTNATPNSNVVTSGTATYNGRNILQTASNADLQFTTAFTNQARAWFAVFRQTTQLSNTGGPVQQYFAIINQTVGGGQDTVAGPTSPTSYSTSTYVMSEGPSGVAAWILTGNTVPNGYNVFGVYTWVNSAASTANNIINVNGTSYALSGANAVASSYNTGNIKYTINTGWYSNACDIAEIICINGEITSTQRQQVEYYLANKWGISGPSSVSYGPPAVSTAAVTTSVLPSNHPYYVLPPATVLPFSPLQISGCCLWLDANDPAATGTQPSAGALASWKDRSGYSNHMTAAGTTPTFSNVPPGAVTFGGAGYYSNATPVFSNFYTAFFVYKQTATAGPMYTTGASSGINGFFPNEAGTTYFTRGDSTWYTTTSPFTSNVKNLATVSFSSNAVGSNESLYYNGSNVVTTTQANTITYTNLLIGSRQSGGTQYFTGSMYEIIAYNGILPSNQQQRVEGYLAQKWKL